MLVTFKKDVNAATHVLESGSCPDVFGFDARAQPCKDIKLVSTIIVFSVFFGKDIGCRSVPFPSSLPPAILNQGARVTYVPTYQTDGFGLLCLDAHSNVPRFTYQNSPSESKGLFLLNREICNDCNDASVQASKKLEVAALLYLASHLFRQHKLQGTLMPARVDGI